MNDSLQNARLGKKVVGEKEEKEREKRRQVESERGSGVTSLLEMTDWPSLFLSLSKSSVLSISMKLNSHLLIILTF